MADESARRGGAVAEQRRRFIAGLEPDGDVAAVVLASWRRCRVAGPDGALEPAARRTLTPAELERRLAAEASLREIARPHLEWLTAAHRDRPHVVQLVDRDGIVLESVGTDAALAELLGGPGADRSETEAGTSGAGTALVAGEPVRIVGAEHWLCALHVADASAAPLRGPGGEVIGAIELCTRAAPGAGDQLQLVAHAAFAIGRDVAQRDRMRRESGPLDAVRRAADTLRENEARFRSLSAASPVGIFESDAQGNITYANGRVLSIFALTPEEGLGRGWIARIHPDDVEAVLTGWGAALRAAREYQHEYRLLLPGNGLRWVHCRAAPLFDAAGAMKGTVGTVEDITERRTLETQLLHAQKMDAVGRLAGGVAHDFNNLLTVIKVHAELALEGLEATSELRPDLEEIARAASRAAGLTRQLLAFSRKQVLQPRVLDVNALVYEIAPMLQRLIGEDIAVATHTEPAPGSVLADPGQLEQVLVNLAVNARDAMPDGGTLMVRTSSVEVDGSPGLEHAGVARGAHVVLSVSDTGCGMSREILDRIFEPFFTTKPAGKGTGLGLPTVYGIVKQSGGHVRVESAPGEGTTFHVYLPRVTAAVAADAAVVSRERPRGSETILLVEDEDAVRRLARRILEQQGYEVLEASDGRDALGLAATHGGTIALVLTDMVMPEMSGRLLAERLRVARPSLPVLYMSGYTDDEIVRRGLRDVHAARAGFLEKPFTADDLAEAVRRALDGARATAA